MGIAIPDQGEDNQAIEKPQQVDWRARRVLTNDRGNILVGRIILACVVLSLGLAEDLRTVFEAQFLAVRSPVEAGNNERRFVNNRGERGREPGHFPFAKDGGGPPQAQEFISNEVVYSVGIEFSDIER